MWCTKFGTMAQEYTERPIYNNPGRLSSIETQKHIYIYIDIFFIFFKFIFNWRIIALHYCVDFCQAINIKPVYIPVVILYSIFFAI